PATQVCPVHVAVVEVSLVSRSAPQVTTVLLPWHTASPGDALAQRGSMGEQLPWVSPGVVSQFWPEGQRGAAGFSVQNPALQTSDTLERLPLHANTAGVVQGHPRIATAPVPAETEQGLP